MKSIAVTWLVAGSLLASGSPGVAASLERPGFLQRGGADVHSGTFAGARFRLSLGGDARPQAKLGLTIAPMMRTQIAGGGVRMRFAEGAGLDFSGSGRVQASLGGKPLNAFGRGLPEPGGQGRQGISTLGVVGIGVGAALVGVVVLFAIYDRNYESCNGGC